MRITTAFALILLTAAGGAGYWMYLDFTAKDRTIAQQARVIGVLEDRMERAWASELVADLRIDAIGTDPATGAPTIGVTFVQYEPGTEKPAFERGFTVTGEEIYIDALVVKFQRKFVEQGDGLRGKSLLVFRRAFGDGQKPRDGTPLYRAADGAPIPAPFQVDAQPGALERRIWTRFWDLANDPERAKSEGVLVAQGEAPHIRPVAGQVYKLTLKAGGGLDITPRLPSAVVGKSPTASLRSPVVPQSAARVIPPKSGSDPLPQLR